MPGCPFVLASSRCTGKPASTRETTQWARSIRGEIRYDPTAREVGVVLTRQCSATAVNRKQICLMRFHELFKASNTMELPPPKEGEKSTHSDSTGIRHKSKAPSSLKILTDLNEQNVQLVTHLVMLRWATVGSRPLSRNSPDSD